MARQPAKVLRNPRLASRRKEVRRQRRRRRGRATMVFVAIASVGVGGWMLARSSLFALDGIEVTGTRLLSPAEVLQASGLHTGQSMLSLHPDRVRALVARIPLVRAVSVQRIPTSRVRIAIVERTPAFVLETVESRWNLDADGTVLQELAGPAPALPTIRLGDGIEADTGDQIRVVALQEAIQLWNGLPSSLRTGGVTIDATSSAGLELLRGGSTIRFGTTNRLSQKLEAVRLIMDRVRQTGDVLVSLDVRSPLRPAARLA